MDNVKTEYTKDDFKKDAPYAELYSIKDEFDKQNRFEELVENCKSVNGGSFSKKYKMYEKKMNQIKSANVVSNSYELTEYNITLDLGEWFVSDDGIYLDDKLVFPHPIFPVRRTTNLDTGISKVQLAFKRNDTWFDLICDKANIASSNKIVDLANRQILVSSENSKMLVKFLNDIESLNDNIIPIEKSVDYFGWVSNKDFVPFSNNVIFDSKDNQFINAINKHGDKEKWLKQIKEIRAGGKIELRLILAASYASALVKLMNENTFLVHLWGGSGNGKTVALMMAASVWGNAEPGEYLKTFNSTDMALESNAATLNSLPLCIDELQVKKNLTKSGFDHLIYSLTEGIGRGRLNPDGTSKFRKKWKNCILSTGEKPITNTSSNGGAVNRVINLDCTDTSIFEKPKEMVNFFIDNCGFSGEDFIKMIIDGTIPKEEIRTLIDSNNEIFRSRGFAIKQCDAGSLVLAADSLITEYIFKDGLELKHKEVAEYLLTEDEVNANVRAYIWLHDWILQHLANFSSDSVPENYIKDWWGYADTEGFYILRNVLNKECEEANFDTIPFLRWLRDNGKTKVDHGHLDIKRNNISGHSGRFVMLLKDDFEPLDDEELDQITPF